MKKTIKHISLLLLLIVAVLPLSGCGKKSESITTMDNAFDALSELEVSAETVDFHEDFYDTVTKNYDESQKKEYSEILERDKIVKITITNPTDQYFNYAPVGLVFAQDTLTQEDLAKKDYRMLIVPITLAPDEENIFYISPNNKEITGYELTIVPYFLPFSSSTIATYVDDPYKSSDSNNDDQSNNDNSKDNKKKNKDKSASVNDALVINTATQIKADSNSDKTTKDQKYIQSYISDEKSSQVVYPGDLSFGKFKEKNSQQDNDEALELVEYSVEITNEGEGTLKVSPKDVSANMIMFGMMLIKDDKICGLQMTSSTTSLTLESGESDTLSTITMGPSNCEPEIIFNGYGPTKGSSESSSSEKGN